MRYRVLMAVGLLSVVVPACGGDSIESKTYMSKCGSAQDFACEKGFSCDSFFVKAQFNSVAHCQSELRQGRLQVVGKLNDGQLESCAQACDQMRADVEAVSCEHFDDATFKRYACGN